LEPEQRQAMVLSDDAFDAGVSALVMARDFCLDQLVESVGAFSPLEGAIWRPHLAKDGSRS
jgi:hypothetical protein